MWLARDIKNNLLLFEDKPTRTTYSWKGLHCKIIYDNTIYPELKWEDIPMEVEFSKIIDRNDPIQFESYGNHLRNLLTPYQNLVSIVEGMLTGKLDEDTAKEFLVNHNFQNDIDKLIEFSKSDKLENINWKE